ncbi:hypothetical protein C5167_029939 [Papaver somniferum]|nr:hypothetical protein C5167_029939 [Papaver somniferum]
MGCDLPTWMCVPSGLPDLVWLNLDIKNCKGIKQLPASIGKLPRLRVMLLRGMSLESLDIGGFPSLIRLELTDMFLLEELCCSYPPCLQDLWINDCQRLREISPFLSLTSLVLGKVDDKLVCSVGRTQTSLQILNLRNIEDRFIITLDRMYMVCPTKVFEWLRRIINRKATCV